MGFVAYGSKNLVTTATLVEEPDLFGTADNDVPPHITSYADNMAILSPRTRVLAYNLPPYTCTEYEIPPFGGVDRMSFKLASPTYVKYVHATGDSWDGQETLDPTTDGYTPVADSTNLGFDNSSGKCVDASNKYWYSVYIFVGNTTDFTEATYCGVAGADSLIEMNDIDD